MRYGINRILPLFLAVFLAGCGGNPSDLSPGDNLEQLGAQQSGGGSRQEMQQSVAGNQSGVSQSSGGGDQFGTQQSSGSGGRSKIQQSSGSGNQPEQSAPGSAAASWEDKRSCIIQEDDSSFYLCGASRLVKIDKATNQSRILWEDADTAMERGMYQYASGSGLLIGDRIYFIERWFEEDGSVGNDALSVINTDGTGYERKDTLTVSGDSYGSMLLQDGILYVSGEPVLQYKMGEDGAISERLDETEAYDNLPDGYGEHYYHNNGRRILFAPESLKIFGNYVVRNRDYDLVILNPDTGEWRKAEPEDCTFDSFNKDYFLVYSYEDRNYCLVDVESLEKKALADSRYMVNVIAMDEEYLYIEDGSFEEERQHIYEKISLKTGERDVIFKQDEIIWAGNPWYLMDIVVQDGYLYYMGEKDYKLYLMRRNLDDPSNEEVLGDALYDSGIGEVGTLKSYYEKINSELNPDFTFVEIDLEWLQVDERFPGAAKINVCLTEAMDQIIAYEKENIEWLEEEVASELENGVDGRTLWHLHCSYSSELSEIIYFDGRYLSFYQADYDYTGGAHGMPYWIGYTFDLQTGERLTLSDVIGNSEEELKELAVKYFGELYEAAPDSFWPDALDTVREYTGLDSAFYLTEEGVRIYFEPYALGAYADGFKEATIPYGELDMKITLGNGKVLR